MQKYDIIVIGAGASGLMAAIQAAELGAKVLILEKMQQPARKLRITGKGRCNLTNIAPLKDFMKHIGVNSNFLYSTFSVFFSEELVKFFSMLGVKTVNERGGRVFPENGKAVEIAQSLVNYCKKLKVDIVTNCCITSIIEENKKIIKIKTKQEEYLAKAFILATGGKSYPATGSTGEGYEWTKKLGHTIVIPKPVLVPLKIAENFIEKLDGLCLKNIRASIWINGKKDSDIFGDMEFLKDSITGPIILTISRQIIDKIISKEKIELSIDLKPALDETKLDNRLIRDLTERSKEQLYSILRGLLPKQLISICLNTLKIDGKKMGHQITGVERKAIRNWLKNFKLQITDHGSWEEAIVTKGGIELKEVHSKNMQSKIIDNLFFAGEILDLDADTGGYNLQIAFSTGYLAGKSAANSVLNNI